MGAHPQRISAARTRIARICASHRIATSVFSTHRRSHRIAARIARYGPLRCEVVNTLLCDTLRLSERSLLVAVTDVRWIFRPTRRNLAPGGQDLSWPARDRPSENDHLTRNRYDNKFLRIIFEGFCALQISRKDRLFLSGTRNSQHDSRESIRANHSQLKPLFL